MTALADMDRIIANLDADSSAESLREALTGLRERVAELSRLRYRVECLRDEFRLLYETGTSAEYKKWDVARMKVDAALAQEPDE